jgi:hypothetical protein
VAWRHGHSATRVFLRDWGGRAAETGEPGEGDEEVVAVSALSVLRVLRDSRIQVLLLRVVAAVNEKAHGGEPVDDMLPPRAG